MRMALLSMIALLFCVSLQANTEEKLKSVFVTKALKTDIYNIFTYPAKIVPSVVATVLSESQGVVTNISKQLGQNVKAGESLISVKHTDPVYRYRPVSVKAPVSGVISSVLVNVGSVVGKGQDVVTITDPEKFKVQIEISLKDLQHLKAGQKGELVVATQAKPLSVQIKGIAPAVDPATGTASAELEILNAPESTLVLGSLGSVSFKAHQRQGFMLPESALVYTGRKIYVRAVDKEDMVSKIEIKTGYKKQDQIEILDGLSEGQDIVVRSSGFIPDGSRVEVKSEQAPKKEEESQEKADNKKSTTTKA